MPDFTSVPYPAATNTENATRSQKVSSHKVHASITFKNIIEKLLSSSHPKYLWYKTSKQTKQINTKKTNLNSEHFMELGDLFIIFIGKH